MAIDARATMECLLRIVARDLPRNSRVAIRFSHIFRISIEDAPSIVVIYSRGLNRLSRFVSMCVCV